MFCLTNHNNAWKLSMIKFGTHLMQLFCGLQSHIVFIRYPFGRNISNCKIRFKIKFVRDNNLLTALSTSQILYIPSFPMIVLTFETFALLVTYTTTCRSDSAEFLMVSESAIRMFFTYKLPNTIPSQTQKHPQKH